MGLILDAGVVLVLGVCLWLGWRRGFVRGIIGMVGTLLAVVLAGWLCTPAAEMAFDVLLEKPSQKVIAAQLSGLPDAGDKEQVAAQLDDYLQSRVPEGARALLEKGGLGTGAQIVAKLPQRAFAGKDALAAEVTAQVVRPALMPAVGGGCFLVLFLLLLVAIQIAARAIDKVFKLPVLRSFNHVGGLALGLLHGVLWVLALVTLVQLYAMFYENSVVSPADLRDSTLAGWVAEHNPIADGIAAAAGKLLGR